MKFVFASDSFKDSISCKEINGILEECARKYFPDCICVSLLVADGGEGTLDAVVSQKHGQIFSREVTGPLGERVLARYGAFGDSAVVCMGEASGLPLLSLEQRNARKTTSYGTGELIRHVLNQGYKTVYVTLGGSATNDGGMGALQALGYRFLDERGEPCPGCGESLDKVVTIDDSSALDTSGVEIVLLCDVSNPLLGDRGATRVYGKQKGASDEDLDFLESGMRRFANVLEEKYKKSPNVAGGGAAGGLGAALRTVLGAEIRSGIETILNLCGYADALQGANLVVTGEGRIDSQSANGKVIEGVLKYAKAAKVPVVAIAGSLGDGLDVLYEKGLTAAFSIVNSPMPLAEALRQAKSLYRERADNLFRLLSLKL